MKGLVCCTILLLACVLVHSQYIDGCSFEDEILSVGTHTRNCQKLNCIGNNKIQALACPLASCLPGQQIGYQEMDFSKPYPQCCGRPICKNS
ncbi:uncharacterized protein LOC105430781 [Pogonomyrmex barbatus]|uniref:Uncharacterized protein LOC105430781 n=1 Tax=Pogonomyrmex barbatus TaxID=144034 RepID=A0A6I9XCV3_9HYME|nr:uncharacterized protein LOC105430781 [Pogonomyrmex barbatus]